MANTVKELKSSIAGEATKKNPDRDYKGEYNRLFPIKMSSSNFLTLYSLYLLDKYDTLYGKEILNHITGVLGSNVWNPSHGTLYPLLQDLEGKGFVTSSEEQQSKKYYRLTEKGRNELESRMYNSKHMVKESYNFFKNVLSDLYGGVDSE